MTIHRDCLERYGEPELEIAKTREEIPAKANLVAAQLKEGSEYLAKRRLCSARKDIVSAEGGGAIKNILLSVINLSLFSGLNCLSVEGEK